MQEEMCFRSVRGTDARMMGRALLGAHAGSGKIVRIVRIDQVATPPFDTTIFYEVDPAQAGDLIMPRTIQAAAYVEMARYAISHGGEFTKEGFWKQRSETEIVAEYNQRIERENMEEADNFGLYGE